MSLWEPLSPPVDLRRGTKKATKDSRGRSRVRRFFPPVPKAATEAPPGDPAGDQGPKHRKGNQKAAAQRIRERSPAGPEGQSHPKAAQMQPGRLHKVAPRGLESSKGTTKAAPQRPHETTTRRRGPKQPKATQEQTKSSHKGRTREGGARHLRSCPKVPGTNAPKFLESCAAAQLLPKFGHPWPMWAIAARCLVQTGQKSGRFRPSVGDSRLTWATFDTTEANFEKCRPEIGQYRPNLAGVGQTWAQIHHAFGPCRAQMGQNRSDCKAVGNFGARQNRRTFVGVRRHAPAFRYLVGI